MFNLSSASPRTKNPERGELARARRGFLLTLLRGEGNIAMPLWGMHRWFARMDVCRWGQTILLTAACDWKPRLWGSTSTQNCGGSSRR